MTRLSILLMQASDRALLDAHEESGTERVRLNTLGEILAAEARVARQKEKVAA